MNNRNWPESKEETSWSDPEQIRTADLPLRRRTLYPAELQDLLRYEKFLLALI